MFLLPALLGVGVALATKFLGGRKQPPQTPPLPSETTPRVLESEAAIRKRLSQTGRGTTIFTGGLFDNPTARKEKLIPV